MGIPPGTCAPLRIQGGVTRRLLVLEEPPGLLHRLHVPVLGAAEGGVEGAVPVSGAGLAVAPAVNAKQSDLGAFRGAPGEARRPGAVVLPALVRHGFHHRSPRQAVGLPPEGQARLGAQHGTPQFVPEVHLSAGVRHEGIRRSLDHQDGNRAGSLGGRMVPRHGGRRGRHGRQGVGEIQGQAEGEDAAVGHAHDVDAARIRAQLPFGPVDDRGHEGHIIGRRIPNGAGTAIVPPRLAIRALRPVQGRHDDPLPVRHGGPLGEGRAPARSQDVLRAAHVAVQHHHQRAGPRGGAGGQGQEVVAGPVGGGHRRLRNARGEQGKAGQERGRDADRERDHAGIIQEPPGFRLGGSTVTWWS